MNFSIGDGLRPGSIADATESLRTAIKQFGDLAVQGDLAKRAGLTTIPRADAYLKKRRVCHFVLVLLNSVRR